MRSFNSSVEYYKKQLKSTKAKNMLVVVDFLRKNAFLSIAPLSKAAHDLGIDMYAYVMQKDSSTLQVLFDTYAAHMMKVPELMDFIKIVNKKTKIDNLFQPPDLILYSLPNKWETNIEGLYVDYKNNWFKLEKYATLKRTAQLLWKELFNLKKKEIVACGFELIPKKVELPLSDYLDSFFISMAMAETAYKHTGKVTMGAASPRTSMREKSEKISDLLSILKGCEYSKNINEPVFKRFNKLSPLLGTDQLKQASAVFGIKAKGYPGKHSFGETIGYPTPNKKSRWQSPGQMFLKLDFYPQTKLDNRDPIARIGFTETLPIDLFIKTNLIDWKKLQKRNKAIGDIVQASDYVIIKGEKVKGGQTSFRVDLVKPDGTHRWVRPSDVDTRQLINKEYLKRTGIRAGNMANIPGGEAFVTPQNVTGSVVGDVVISIDRSYKLKASDPIILDIDGNYKIKKGPKDIMKVLNKQKKDAWNRLLEMEKAKAMPKSLIDMKKRNFNRIGEFAVNTNPTAELSDYLIVNEKIANMIHIALGSGFEPDTSSEYHYDIVINAPRQKLDIYGVDSKGKEKWILKKGKFVA